MHAVEDTDRDDGPAPVRGTSANPCQRYTVNVPSAQAARTAPADARRYQRNEYSRRRLTSTAASRARPASRREHRQRPKLTLLADEQGRQAAVGSERGDRRAGRRGADRRIVASDRARPASRLPTAIAQPDAVRDQLGLLGGQMHRPERRGRRLRQWREFERAAELVECFRRLDRIWANPGPTQRREMTARAQGGTQVARDGPDVGAA